MTRTRDLVLLLALAALLVVGGGRSAVVAEQASAVAGADRRPSMEVWSIPMQPVDAARSASVAGSMDSSTQHRSSGAGELGGSMQTGQSLASSAEPASPRRMLVPLGSLSTTVGQPAQASASPETVLPADAATTPQQRSSVGLGGGRGLDAIPVLQRRPDMPDGAG
jgi:hypothetical protein